MRKPGRFQKHLMPEKRQEHLFLVRAAESAPQALKSIWFMKAEHRLGQKSPRVTLHGLAAVPEF
jgi:hypothetical protein